MSIADLSIKRPVMVSMFLLVFVVFGIISYFSLDLNLIPETDVPYVNITTVYPGAGSEEIEAQVSKKIEDAVSQISGIKRMISYSFSGVSLVNIEFKMDKDGDVANQEVKDKVDAIINDLPSDALKPLVEKMDVQALPVCDVLLTGDMDIKGLYELADKKISDLLAQTPGVAKVNIIGGAEREVHVKVDQADIFENKLSLSQLSQIIQAQNIDLPSGHFLKGSQEISVKTRGQIREPLDLGKIEIQTPKGRKRLSEIADIEDTTEEVRKRTIYFNKINNKRENKAILLEVVKSSDGNSVNVVKGVTKRLAEIEEVLPQGVTLKMVTDKSTFIKDNFDDTMMTIILGIIITGIILFLFLHNIRATIIVAVVMPYSIISTFMFLSALDFSLNLMSLMGFSVSVGVLVSNAVVVIENIFKYKKKGESSPVAASKGTREVVIAVVASTLTNVVVFLPIANMSSLAGTFFKEFAMTVTIATFFSLLASFTLTPMLSAYIIKGLKEPGIVGKSVDRFVNFLSSKYSFILKAIMKNKLRSSAVVMVAAGLLVITMIFAGSVGMSFVPVADEGDINLEIELPVTANIHATAEIVKEVENKIKDYKYLKQIIVLIGKVSESEEGPNMALLKLKLIPVTERELSSDEVVQILKDKCAGIAGADIRIKASQQLSNGQAPIEFYVQGNDMKELEKYSDILVQAMKKQPGLFNVNSSLRPSKPEVNFIPDRVKIAEAGTTVYEIALSLRAALEGIEVSSMKNRGEIYDVRLTLKDDNVDSPEKISALTISSMGKMYRLDQLGIIEFIPTYNKIIHNKKYKAVKITASNTSDFSISSVMDLINKKVEEMNMPRGYSVDFSGDVQNMSETGADIVMTFIIAVILTYMLIAAILESLVQPLIILATVPLAMIGVYSGLIGTGLDMSLFGMMGIIMLIGIVVNNAILILDHTNQLRKSGTKVKDALVEAGREKLRPILMSSMAIIFGMMPMAMGIGAAGREMREPLGVVSVAGLLASTILTLIVIPAAYYLIYGRKEA